VLLTKPALCAEPATLGLTPATSGLGSKLTVAMLRE
jgi:hypothetical protein